MTLKQISIPYGAIKSEVGQIIYTVAEEFQFLMVRLKVSCPKAFSQVCFLFQFLMVRLKEILSRLKNQICKHFNSLWCD